MEQLIPLFERLGIPLGLLILTYVGIWKAAKWCAPHIARLVDNTAENKEGLKVMAAKDDERHGAIIQRLDAMKGQIDELISVLIHEAP